MTTPSGAVGFVLSMLMAIILWALAYATMGAMSNWEEQRPSVLRRVVALSIPMVIAMVSLGFVALAVGQFVL